jgi:superfamily II DNA or RNA helicase
MIRGHISPQKTDNFSPPETLMFPRVQQRSPPFYPLVHTSMQEIAITISSDLALSGIPNDFARMLKGRLTIDNPMHRNAVKFGRSTRNIDRVLKMYSCDPDGVLRVPRGYGVQLHALAATHGLKPKYTDQRRVLAPVEFCFCGKLREYQNDALKDILKRDFGVLQAGTGSGKTVMALAVIAERKQPVLILVHTRELMNQWVERIEQFLGCPAGRIGAGSFDLQPVTVGIVNSVKKRLQDLVPCFGMLVVDECHRIPSTTFTTCIASFDAKFMLGLSATPYRRDGLTRLIYLSIGDCLHIVDPERLKTLGAILAPEVVLRETGFHFPRAADRYAKMLTKLALDQDRNMLIAGDVLKEVAKNSGTVLLVSERTVHLHALAEILEEHGEHVVILTGKTPAVLREAIVKDVQAGAVRIMASTTQLIGEGFDCPGLTTLFLCSPIRFSGRLVQIVGRILRPQDGKRPRIYDYQDVCVGILKASAQARMSTYSEM